MPFYMKTDLLQFPLKTFGHNQNKTTTIIYYWIENFMNEKLVNKTLSKSSFRSLRDPMMG